MGSVVRPLLKPLLAHNGLDGVNKLIYGGSGIHKDPANPLAVPTDGAPSLATPLGRKVPTTSYMYTNAPDVGVQQ